MSRGLEAVPNKPMVPTATGALWIARPAEAAAHRRAVGPRCRGRRATGGLVGFGNAMDRMWAPE